MANLCLYRQVNIDYNLLNFIYELQKFYKNTEAEIIFILNVRVMVSKFSVDRKICSLSNREILLLDNHTDRKFELLNDELILTLESPLLFSDKHIELQSKGFSFDLPTHITLAKSVSEIPNIKPYPGTLILGPEILEEIQH